MKNEHDDDKTKIVTKNDNKTKLIITTVTKTDNQTKIVNKTVKNSCKVYIILTIVSIIIYYNFYCICYLFCLL